MGWAMILAIRVLRDGVPIREEIFTSTPIRIGRAPHSDLILVDPTVSRDHARIERDQAGGLVIVDGAGANGLYAGPKRVDAERLKGRFRARLGLAEIEIEEVSADRTQPVSLDDLHQLDQRRTPLTWAKYGFIVLLALNLETLMAPEFWSPWNPQRVVGMVWQSASALVAILIFGSILLGLLRAAGRKVRMADVLQHFAAFIWLRPLAVAASLLGYYVVSDGLAGSMRSWLPSLATVAFLAQAAAIRRPPPNRAFRSMWAVALLLVVIGFDFTQSYAARRMGQPAIDQTVQVPIAILGPGPTISFERYSLAVDAAGKRSEAAVR
jgi:hypothetical protein